MSAYFDPERIRRLEEVMGSDTQSIVASMLAGMTEAIEEVEAGVAAGDLDRVIRAAHRCRNDAMALGAGQLLEALTAVEAAGRDYDEAGVIDALGRVRKVWPLTRDELAGVANPP